MLTVVAPAEILHVDKFDVRTPTYSRVFRNETLAMTKVRSDCRQQFVHDETVDSGMKPPFVLILSYHCSLVLG